MIIIFKWHYYSFLPSFRNDQYLILNTTTSAGKTLPVARHLFWQGLCVTVKSVWRNYTKSGNNVVWAFLYPWVGDWEIKFLGDWMNDCHCQRNNTHFRLDILHQTAAYSCEQSVWDSKWAQSKWMLEPSQGLNHLSVVLKREASKPENRGAGLMESGANTFPPFQSYFRLSPSA